MRFAIVTSKFNAEVTNGLREGALAYLKEKEMSATQIELFEAPGAFETPLIAQKLARTGRFSGVICLGSVIKGETAHFEFISLGASMGIMQAMLSTNVPISFGILTTYTDEQAALRSANDQHNKGREAAAACFETALLFESIRRD